MISFIVPAFNEGAVIKDTIATIRTVVKNYEINEYEIIPIDDGSSDDTKIKLEKLAGEDPKIRPVYHPENMGLGRSIINGVAKATKERFVIIPGDNDISHISLGMILGYRNEAEMILTVPLNKEARPIGRQIISSIYQLIYSACFGTAIGYINGPGIWPTEKVKTLNLKSNRFSIISEMNVKLLTSGVQFAEVPIYVQAVPPDRSTVTLKNFIEVAKIFVMQIVDLKLKSDRPKLHPLNRVQIDFRRKK